MLASGYQHTDNILSFTHSYTAPVVFETLAGNKTAKLIELGCGNGSFAAELAKRGYDVTAIDPSATGIRLAKSKWPEISFHEASTDQDLASDFGRFQFVISLDVIEHIYLPRTYLRRIRDLLTDDGLAIVSTPYHGYIKNLSIALAGKFDGHFCVKNDHGHIKFFSIQTLTDMATECGLAVKAIHRVGRIPAMAKSMVFILRRAD